MLYYIEISEFFIFYCVCIKKLCFPGNILYNFHSQSFFIQLSRVAPLSLKTTFKDENFIMKHKKGIKNGLKFCCCIFEKNIKLRVPRILKGRMTKWPNSKRLNTEKAEWLWTWPSGPPDVPLLAGLLCCCFFNWKFCPRSKIIHLSGLLCCCFS